MPALGSGPRLRLPSLSTTRGFVALLLGYLLVHLGLRLLVLPPVLTIDDAREAVLGQTLAWGYQPRQPPLYNWLVWAGFRLFGVGVLSLALVKYAVLGAAYAFVYASARRVLGEPRLAALATGALVLIFPVSWTFHETLTHSAAVFAASAATVYVLLRLEASGSLGSYLALGAALSLGMLSKFTYAAFAAALLLAALTLPRFRRRLLHPRMLVALLVAGALVIPFAAWFVRHGDDLGRLYARHVRIDQGHGYWGKALGGLAYLVRITVYYLTPIWLVFLVLFPGVYRRLPRPPDQHGDAGLLLGRFFACAFGLLTAGALLGALAYLKFRWMLPTFFLAPLYAFWRLQRAGYDGRRLRWLGVLLLVTEAGILTAIVVVVMTGSLLGRPSDLDEPYDRLVDEIGDAGFRRGTIVVGPGPLAGSLRLRFPDSRVISLEHPYYVPPAPDGGQCLLAWEKGAATVVPPGIQELLASALDARLTGVEPIRVLEAPYHHAPDFRRRVSFTLLEHGLGRCR